VIAPNVAAVFMVTGWLPLICARQSRVPESRDARPLAAMSAWERMGPYVDFGSLSAPGGSIRPSCQSAFKNLAASLDGYQNASDFSFTFGFPGEIARRARCRPARGAGGICNKNPTT
jgi:hypothetical protein